MNTKITVGSAGSALCAALMLGLAGCGGGELAPVSGKVTFKGAPIKGGTLIFSPVPGTAGAAIAGKPASAEVGADGSYSLQTNRPLDGAKIGKQRVTFTPPPQQLTEAQRTNPRYKAPAPLYMGLVANPGEVEVKPGPNTIDLELVAPRK
jgi:hypothetical protein